MSKQPQVRRVIIRVGLCLQTDLKMKFIKLQLKEKHDIKRLTCKMWDFLPKVKVTIRVLLGYLLHTVTFLVSSNLRATFEDAIAGTFYLIDYCVCLNVIRYWTKK